ncbi:uncharacterized protein LOC143049696 [Mytilus galloprovincialis]|uniref:uncharacterized protein LOC134690627 n=1 Tax=Mytilus trossulus TaxID=6551 RepID=UPI0030055429
MDELPQQSKSEGNKHCCYGTCNSDTRYRHREEMKDVFFIPFPKPTTRRETCLKWIKACGRPGNDFNVDKIKRSTYICSKHFVGESGPTAENPDPIPALLHTDEQVERFERKRKAPTPRRKPIKISKKDIKSAAEGLLDLSNDLNNFPETTHVHETSLLVLCPVTDASSQTVDVQTNDKEVQTIYEKEVLNAKIENMILKNQMRNCESRQNDQPNEQNDTTLSLKAIKDNDVKMKLFTGLTYAQFCILFNFLGTSVYNLTYWDGKNDAKESSRKGNRKLEPKDELFLTLVRLRRGYSIDTISHFFGIASSTVSIVFTTWIQLLYCHFNELRHDMFPERQHFKVGLPKVFKTFKNIRCTIDCTEFFVQMPRDFKRQGNLYSSYKNHHTYKCLIGIAPNGSIVYVSDLFEGSISDRAIIEQSGFLDYINPGDLVLADRGFTIKDLLLKRQAFLNIPPFLGKRTKFTAQEELTTRRIAKARIHVERVIERVKKFKLLSGNIPLSLSPIANQLVFVASSLVNFQEPLVK